MFISLRTKIWLTVVTIVLLFTFFTLFYFPSQQRRFLLNNYNNEVQNLAGTVALGVRIALNEQNYEGVRTAMEFVKDNPNLLFVSLLQYDTIWNDNHTKYLVQETVFKTFPERFHPEPSVSSNDSMIVKHAHFETSLMSGAILLAFSTEGINKSEKEIFRTSLIISGGIFLVGMLIGLLLSRKISAPVIALRNAAQRVAKGDLTPVVKDFSKDEVGDLAIAFNTMVQELSNSREELHNTNRTLTETNATLSKTLEDLRATQKQLIQSEKMASLGELTAGIAHEIQNPLNFVNNFSELSAELIDELEAALKQGHSSEVPDVAGNIRENLQKITHHGRRADAIVKSMLQHSRKSTGQKEPTDINALVDEYLRLSYHGLRAKDKAFSVSLQTNFDETAGKIEVVPQDIGRALLNLFNNAFYAVNEKKKRLNGSFEPVVQVSTKRKANEIEIAVTDNGTGISQKVLDKIYHPFFTTKPAGEGTGLGLSLSYEIINKEHGGQLLVETKEGEGAVFKIILPAKSN